MASTLGSLIVQLGADTATLQSDLGRANAILQRHGEEMRKQAVQMSAAMGAAVAGAAAALGAMVKSSINLGDELGKLSQKVGVSAENLSILKYQAGQANVEFSTLQTGLTRFNRVASEASAGSQKQAAAFAAMGISLRDIDGRLKSTDRLMQEVAQSFAGYRDGATKTALAIELFGRAGADMIPMLNEGAAGFDAARAEAEAYGIVVSNEAARASEEFNSNLGRLKASAQGFGNQLMHELIPALTALSGHMAEGAKRGEEYSRAAKGISDTLQGAVKWALTAKLGIEALTNVVAASIDVFKGFGEIAAAALNNIGYALASMGAAASGNFALAKQWMDRAGEAMADGWERGSKRIVTAWNAAKDGISDARDINEQVVAAMERYKRGAADFSNVVGGVGKAAEKTEAPVLALGEAVGKVGRAAADTSRDLEAWRNTVDRLAATLDGPLASAQHEHDSRLAAATRALAEGKIEIADYIRYRELLAEQLRRTNESIAKQGDVLGAFSSGAAQQRAMIGMTARQRAIEEAVRKVTEEYRRNEAAGIKMADSLQFVQAGAAAAAGGLFDAQAEADELEAILSRFGEMTFGETMVAGIARISEELDKVSDTTSDAFDPKAAEELRRVLSNMRSDLQQHNLALASQGVASLQQFAKEGTAAYKALGVAQDVLAYKSAVAAIANQGSGDPYTAFARIAAMIALMASIGIRVGGGGSSAPNIAAERQALQGTGSVLGDASAKSESIARAVEITASATQQLVGINRGMLSALQSLQRALGAAGGMLARGAGDAQFAGIGGSFNIGDPFGGDPLGRALGKLLFGGSKKIVDQGIIIAGGALSDMINDIAVGAYQTVHTSGGLFRSSKTRDSLADVPDEFARQFQLVIGSIADTVREGATALGLLPADIEQRMAAFRSEEMRISLKDLSAEEQQKELEAVFSKLFDGLAGAVVPWIEQFQQVGEGLGETLIRVATQVQVAQEAFRQLGMAVDRSDPEKFAQISDALIQAVGGLDDFISQFTAFVSHFATEEHQFRVAQEALTSAFEQVNLVLPETREGMWALMQTLDATTESGREQIATLLRLADTADQYYSALEKLASDLVGKIEGAYDELSKFGIGVGDPGERLRAINQAAIDAVNAANMLAKAAGQQGAAEWQLALIHRVAAGRAAEAIAQLMQATQELVAQFYGDDLAGAADSAAHAVSGFGSAMSDAAQRASDAIRLLLGDLSPLNDQMKLQVALDALSRGEVGREDVLEIGRRLYASSQAYNDLFNRVMRMNVPTPGTAADYTGGMAMADIAEQVTPEQRARERMDLAMQIGQNVATLANAQGEEFADIADMLGLNLGDIAEVMGLSNDELTAWLENLVEMENRTPDSIRDGADRIIEAMYDIADGDYMPATPPASPYVPEAVATQGETAAEVRDLLRELVAAVREGDGEVVSAVREVVGAAESVSREIRDSDERAEIYGRRNERTMTR